MLMQPDDIDKVRGWRMPALKLCLLASGLVVAVILSSSSEGTAFDMRSLLPVLLVQPVNAAGLFLMGWRLSVLSRGQVTIWRGIKASALAGTLLYITPGRLSELIKPVYLSAHCGHGLLQGVALLAVERFLDILIVVAGGAAALLLLSGLASAATLWLWVLLSVVGLSGCLLLLRYPAVIVRIISFLPGETVRMATATLVEELRLVVAPRILGTALVISLAVWLMSFGLVYATLNLSASLPLDLTAVLLVFVAGTIGLAVSFAPGGLGTFEAGVVVALKYHGIDTLEALNLALMIRLANLGFVPLVGLWTASADRLGVAELVRAVRSIRAGSG
jgi:glycosyltransferase 2 family protein